jgi:hypothetical protein
MEQPKFDAIKEETAEEFVEKLNAATDSKERIQLMKDRIAAITLVGQLTVATTTEERLKIMAEIEELYDAKELPKISKEEENVDIVRQEDKDHIGEGMQRGTIIVKKNAGDWLGKQMEGGKIISEKDVGQFCGSDMHDGVIIVKGSARNGWVAPMMEGGMLTVEGYAKHKNASGMIGGTLDIRGEVESFAESAFSEENKGKIIWKNVTIWDNGWTKEGEAMDNRHLIPKQRD